MDLVQSLEDISILRESHSLECKLAQGKDGSGALPADFWPTYSAFANTDGGFVLLGVREKSGKFELAGITRVDKVLTELFAALNNPNKVSKNLLTNQSVMEIVIDGQTCIMVEIPRAGRKDQPVHLTKNPLSGNSYRRLNESDCALSDDEVRRMLAEQVEDSRDNKILEGYSIDDLSAETLRAYRQVFENRDSAHPWNFLSDHDFLLQLGGIRKDRVSKSEGLTVAGLLMFGLMTSIQDALPNYMLDYQERPEAKTETRWVDRLTLDGKWSGNLYDFYRRVYLKLTADLKVPFRLEDGERQEETVVHVALREALANVIAHADYSERASVLVVKRPDMFGFRNPGLMRIPVEVARQGGEADCRNRTIHKMLRLVGVGEQAGTGIPKIFQGWRSQHWSPPNLFEKVTPYNQTILELRMIDLFPPEVIAKLRSKFGAEFDTLSQDERMAMALAASEGTVNHARLCTVSTSHPVELSRAIQHLVQSNLLVSTGGGRGAVYYLPGQEMPSPDDVFGPQNKVIEPEEQPHSKLSNLRSSSSVLKESSSGLDTSSSDLEPIRNDDGYLLTEQLALPLIDNLELLSEALRTQLEAIAIEPRSKGKIERKAMEEVLRKICIGHYLTLQCVAELVARQPNSLRNEYLSPMVRSRSLSLAFPKTPTHERQAYCTTSSLPNNENANS